MNINNLPVEVLVSIFKYIPSNDIFLYKNSICKIWNTILNIPTFNKIRKLDLKGRLVNENINNFCKILSKNNVLKELDISSNGLNDIEIKIILDSLTNGLRILKLEDNNFSSEGINYVCSYVLRNNDKLELSLSKNYINTNSVSSISDHIGYVTKLNLSNTNLNSYGCKCLLNCSRSIYLHIESLDLSSNMIGKLNVIQISKFIVNARSLNAINLSNNNLCSSGIYNLCIGLNNSNISSLDISDNRIGSKAGNYLFEVLSQNTRIDCLNISNNMLCVTSGNLDSILTSDKVYKLLDISSNKIRFNRYEDLFSHEYNIKSLLVKNTSMSVEDFKWLMTKVGLECDLNLADNNVSSFKIDIYIHFSCVSSIVLRNNNLTDYDVYIISFVIFNNGNLKCIDLKQNNKITEKGLIYILNSLPYNGSLKRLYVDIHTKSIVSKESIEYLSKNSVYVNVLDKSKYVTYTKQNFCPDGVVDYIYVLCTILKFNIVLERLDVSIYQEVPYNKDIIILRNKKDYVFMSYK